MDDPVQGYVIHITYPDGYFKKPPRELTIGKEFNEADHPRDSDGKFTDGNGGTATATAPPAAFVPAKTIDEAKAYAQSLGVDSSEYGTKVHVANKINEGLAKLKEQGIPLPGKVSIDASRFRYPGSKKIPAFYVAGEDAMIVNPGSPFWGKDQAKIDELRKVNFEKGWLSSADPYHIVYHEAGHSAHFKANPTAFHMYGANGSAGIMDHSTKERLSGKVSKYALTNKAEFVAEVFAGHLAGRKFDDDVWRMYDLWGGHKVKR